MSVYATNNISPSFPIISMNNLNIYTYPNKNERDTSRFGKVKRRRHRKSKYDVSHWNDGINPRPFFENVPGQSKFYQESSLDVLASGNCH